MRKKKSNQKWNDFIPAHIGEGFLQSLRELVEKQAPDSFRERYLQIEYLSKYVDPTIATPDMRRKAAIKKWHAAEARNAATNIRLMMADPEMAFSFTTWGLLRARMRKIIADILGPCPYPTILWDSKHTGGASTRVNRSPTAVVDKLTGRTHCSSSASTHWPLASISTMLEDQELELQEASVMFTVPKSTLIDRVCCKEPEINMFLQRSVGNRIRLSLRKVGVTLNDQGKNQKLASVAVKQSLATIDLSSASDTISHQLVLELLPWEWYSLLDDLRVKGTLIDGSYHSFDMFSSMGNGFTFELESLLFYAITRAVCELSNIPIKGAISVYGDDIIAPVSCVPRLSRVLHFLGFSMNPKKTHYAGLFRESCGRHYYGGVEVTPFYIREPIATMSALIKTLNQLLKWGSQGWGFLQTPELAEFHLKWSAIVPNQLRGGQNVESIDSLVDGGYPRERIQQKTVEVACDEYARYRTWHITRRLMGPIQLDVSKTKLIPTYGREPFIFEVPLAVTPKKEVYSILSEQPDWLERTTWTPYAIIA